MARNARDLRDIINISRLSLREDDDNECKFSSDEDKMDNDDLSDYLAMRPSSALGVASSFKIVANVQSKHFSVCNNRENIKDQEKVNRPSTVPHRKREPLSGIKPRINNNNGRVTVPLSKSDPVKLQFPSKFSPVPPIDRKEVRKNTSRTKDLRRNFDYLFDYLDGAIVNKWLEKCNESMKYLSQFVSSNMNFINFAAFILEEIKYEDYCNLLDLEFSIIVDRLKYGFHAGYNINLVKDEDVLHLATSILPEYHDKFKNKSGGRKDLLDVLVIISSSKTDCYRGLLKRTHCYTSNKNYIQWLLAIRAHGLISFLTGIVQFYHDVKVLEPLSKASLTKSAIDIDNIYTFWALSAIEANNLVVMDYLYGNINFELSEMKDNQGRNLLFTALDYGHEDIFYYLCQVSFDLLFPIFRVSTKLNNFIYKNNQP